MASLRRVGTATAVYWSCRSPSLESGLSSSLRSALVCPPAGSSFHGNAGSLRSMSSGGGERKSLLQGFWDTTRFWIREKSQKYSKLIEEFEEADRHLKTLIQAGKYIYIATGAAISGGIYLVDLRVDWKVDKRCKEVELKVEQESKSGQEFQRIAIRDFQDHVSKTQAVSNGIQTDVSKLRQKFLDNQEADMEHRQVAKAAKFLSKNGYLIVSSEEFDYLVNKVNELEKKTSKTATHQVSLNADELTSVDGTVMRAASPAVVSEVNELEKKTSKTATHQVSLNADEGTSVDGTVMRAANPAVVSEVSFAEEDEPSGDLPVKRASTSHVEKPDDAADAPGPQDSQG